MRFVGISIADILLLPALLYFPPVQHGVTRLAENWVAENTSMRISVGKFSLQFPLTISLHDFTLWEAEGDTILDASAIKTDIALMPLLKKREIKSALFLHATTLKKSAFLSFPFS